MSTSPHIQERPVILGSIWALSLFASAYEIVPASVAPPLMAQLGVDATAVGWLVSVMFAVPVLWSLPSGWLIRRLRLRTSLILAGGVLCLSGIVGWYFVTTSAYGYLLATRVVGGMAFVLMWNAALETYGRFEQRATATSLFIASSPVGFALGHVTGPLLTTRFGVASVFLVYSLFVLLSTVAVAVFGMRLPRQMVTQSDSGTALSGIRSLLGNPAFIIVCVLGFLSYSLYLFVNSWMPSYLNAHLGFSLTQSGLMIALFPLIGGLSRTTGGVLVDRFFGGRRRPVILGAFVLTALFVCLLAISQRFVLVSFALVGSGWFVQLSLGLFYSYVPELLAGKRVSGGIALLTALSMSGAFSAPVIAAWLLEYSNSYVVPFGYAVMLAFLGVVVAVRFEDPVGS